MLYPLDLVAVDERFGSWMTQYGYANYITQEKLLERGTVGDGAIEIAGRRFTTLVSLVRAVSRGPRLLDMMRTVGRAGGRVVWSGPPPVVTGEGRPALPRWQALFGVDYHTRAEGAWAAGGGCVESAGASPRRSPAADPHRLLVDRIYPVQPRARDRPGGESRSTDCRHEIAAARRGQCDVLGYRPRDDQSQSLGYETRNWFDVLSALGAYPPTGRFPGVNDNTEHVSRTTDYPGLPLPQRRGCHRAAFPHVAEGWPGGFARNQEEDKRYMANTRCPDDLHLET